MRLPGLYFPPVRPAPASAMFAVTLILALLVAFVAHDTSADR